MAPMNTIRASMIEGAVVVGQRYDGCTSLRTSHLAVAS